MAADEIDVVAAGLDANPQRPPAHLRHGRAFVVHLHLCQAVRELAYLLDVGQLEARQEADSDAAPIGQFRTLGQPVASQALA